MKKVSVIVPVYNTGIYLRRCLDSLVNQTIKDIEIIIVDDGSTDESPVILDEYATRYPNLIQKIRKENGGQGSARNIALPMCTGEYVTALDSDDYMELDAYEKMYNCAIENNADYVGCGYKSVVVDGEEIVSTKVPVYRKTCTNSREMFIDALVNMFTTLYKRSILIESGARYPEGLIYEDTAFYIEPIPWVQKPVYVHEPLACRTIRAGSTMTNSKPEKVANIFSVLSYALDFFKEKEVYENYKEEIEYFCGKLLLCSSLNRISFIKKNKDRKTLIRKTTCFFDANLRDFRKNVYIPKGVKGFYLKHYNKALISLVVWALHIRFLIRKDYL